MEAVLEFIVELEVERAAALKADGANNLPSMGPPT
jgi:hypothetical protein